MTGPRIASTFRFSSIALIAAIGAIAGCQQQASLPPAERGPTAVVLAEFEGEVRDGVLTIKSIPSAAADAVREQALSEVVEDKNGARGTSSAIDRFEFAVEAQSGIFEKDRLGQQANGCGPGAPSSNFAITARAFQANGLASAYMELVSITSDGAPAPQFALCNSDRVSPNVVDDLTGIPLSDEFGLIRYGNLRPDNTPGTAPVPLTVGKDGTASTMIWKFRAGNFAFRGRLMGLRCTSDLCVPGVVMGEGKDLPAVQADFWEPNGPVNAIAEGSGVVYVGGDFTMVAPRTGVSASFDLSKPSTADIPVRPYGAFELSAASGAIRAIAPDGAGGYYVAGNQLRAGFQNTSANIWHILANGRIDTAFKVTVAGAGAQVRALAFDGASLYIGGSFTTVTPVGAASATRRGAASLNAATGAVESFDPNFVGAVNAIVVDGGRVYFGGDFTSPRALFAAFTKATGIIDGLVLNGLGTQSINALALNGAGLLYVGGSFTAAPGTQPNLGAWQTATGTRVTTFAPNVNLAVQSLAFRPGATPVLFVGTASASGAFKVGSSNRLGLAALRVTGVAFNFNAGLNGIVHSIAIDGNNVIAGGVFNTSTTSLVKRRENIAAFDATALGATSIMDFSPHASGAIFAVAIDAARRLFVGGQATSIGGKVRSGLVAMDLTTGTPTPFDAGLNGGVNAIAVDTNGDVYFAGIFADIKNGALTRFGAAAVTLGGIPTDFDPDLNPDAVGSAIVLDGTDVIIGGDFFSAAGLPRSNIGRFSKATGSHNPAFLASADAPVRALELRDNQLYIGGEFSTPANRLGSISPTTGVLIRDYDLDNSVFALTTSQRDVFATGAFAEGLVSFNIQTGAVVWSADIVGVGRGIALAGNYLYVVGDLADENARCFLMRKGVEAPLTPANEKFDAFHPFLVTTGTFVRGPVNAVAVVAEKVLLGGEFNGGDFEVGIPMNTFGITGAGGSNPSRVDRSSLVGVHAN